MEKFINFFKENSAQFWTLASVIVGGIITYISTAAAEHRKDKRQTQKDKLGQVLIPYCTCLEQTVAKANQMQQMGLYPWDEKTITDQEFEEYLSALNTPSTYLEAAKRAFLSQAMRKKLESYQTAVRDFLITLKDECAKIRVEYENYVLSKLKQFPFASTSENISIIFEKDTDVKIKKAIIKKEGISLIDDFSSVVFLEKDAFERPYSLDIDLDDEIKENWRKIDLKLMDISDIEDSDEMLAYNLLDYLYKNTSDEKEALSSIIGKTKSSDKFNGIIEKLNQMIKELNKEIDKITK